MWLIMFAAGMLAGAILMGLFGKPINPETDYLRAELNAALRKLEMGGKP